LKQQQIGRLGTTQSSRTDACNCIQCKKKKKKNEEINYSRSNNDNILASAQPDVIRPHWTRLANNNFKKV
jgi:hypothetical protein